VSAEVEANHASGLLYASSSFDSNDTADSKLDGVWGTCIGITFAILMVDVLE